MPPRSADPAYSSRLYLMLITAVSVLPVTRLLNRYLPPPWGLILSLIAAAATIASAIAFWRVHRATRV